MSYRETFQSTILPVLAGEHIDSLNALWVHRVPEELCPSGTGIGVMCLMKKVSDINYFRWPVLIFDAADGSYQQRYGNPDGLFHLSTRGVWELPNTTYDSATKTFGGTLMIQRSTEHYQFQTPISIDPAIGEYDAIAPELWPAAGYWGGNDIGGFEDGTLYDPINDIFMAEFNGTGQARVAVYTASTGAFLRTIGVAGSVYGLSHMNPPYALAFSANNNVTQFNYLTGQIMGVSRLPDYDTTRGEGVADRKFCYDRYNHRILFCGLTSLDADGLETTLIRGCSPVPQAAAIVPPYTTKQVQTNRSVKIFTRVIGAAGEPIGAVNVDFVDQAVGDVNPVSVVTDREGYAIADYDGLVTGGAETITVNTEQAETVFTGSISEGAGAGNAWSPTVHLDFNGQGVNEDLSNLITQQVNWDQVGAYGTFGDQIIARPVKTSSAELRIESGDDGISAPSFGGDLVMDLSSAQTIPRGEHLWVGVWVYFPTGFDFSTTSDGLRLFQIRDNFWLNPDPEADINFELRLKHNGGTTHLGYSLAWPNATVTDTRHDFLADSSVLTSVDTWHFIQYHMLKTSAASGVQELWIDDLLIWRLANTAAQYRDSAGAGALTSFTANEGIATTNSIYMRADELRVFRDWEGGAPSDQTCYVSNVIWTRDDSLGLPLDELGNRYISKAFAENF